MSGNQSAEQALDLVIAGGGMAGSMLAYAVSYTHLTLPTKA